MLKTDVINENNFSKRLYKKIDVSIEIEEKEYKRGLKYFPKDTGNQAAAATQSTEIAEDETTMSSKSPEPPLVPGTLVQFLTHATKSVADADKEIEKIKKQIEENWEQSQELSKDRESHMSAVKRNLESFAAKITFENPADQVQGNLDLEIQTCIRDIEKGTKKTKEMQQLVQTLQEEVVTLNAPRFELKSPDTLITALLEVFAQAGGTLMQVLSGSTPGGYIVFVVHFHSREDLQHFWKMYNKSKTIHDMLKTTLINEKNFGKRLCKKLYITVDIDEKKYKRVLKNFPKDIGKQAATTQGAEATTEAETSKPPELPPVSQSLVQFLTQEGESVADADKEIKKSKWRFRKITSSYEYSV
ncbi:uncharacterized protein [Amphiura filiformis]|uniref:uncharacterized protein n=1 Tax=Amphiura filiformis TaxID=82378 RepID=UPI003B21E500